MAETRIRRPDQLPLVLTSLDVLRLLGCSRPQFAKLRKAGGFPAPIRGFKFRWHRDAVLAFIEEAPKRRRVS